MFSVKKRSSFCHNLSNMRHVTEEYDARAERLASQLIEQEEQKNKVAEARSKRAREKKQSKKLTTRSSPSIEAEEAPLPPPQQPPPPPPSPQPPAQADDPPHPQEPATSRRTPADIRVALSLLQDLVPDDLCCPLSCAMYDDPVVTCDGHSYSRAEIEKWFLKNDTSPNTNEKLDSKTLFPNLYLRGKVDEYVGIFIS